MENLIFTPATKQDAPVLVEILTDSTVTKLNHGDTIWGSLDEGWSTQEVIDNMTESTAYIIYKDDEPVSTISLQYEDRRMWGEQPKAALYLHRLGVKAGMNGQGLGKIMMNWAADQALAQNKSFLRLDCPADNESLCNFYEKQGFVMVSINSNNGHDGYIAALYERSVQ